MNHFPELPLAGIEQINLRQFPLFFRPPRSQSPFFPTTPSPPSLLQGEFYCPRFAIFRNFFALFCIHSFALQKTFGRHTRVTHILHAILRATSFSTRQRVVFEMKKLLHHFPFSLSIFSSIDCTAACHMPVTPSLPIAPFKYSLFPSLLYSEITLLFLSS